LITCIGSSVGVLIDCIFLAGNARRLQQYPDDGLNYGRNVVRCEWERLLLFLLPFGIRCLGFPLAGVVVGCTLEVEALSPLVALELVAIFFLCGALAFC